jgi:hypothetical protein
MSSALSVLSPSLSAKLAALAKQPAHTEARHVLDEILAELANLPAHSVVRANREIATSAHLGWWQPEKRPMQIVPTHGALPFQLARLKYLLGLERVPSDTELLAANPNFAWLFLFHPSGFLREAALGRIASAPTSPFFLAALAWRLNDWVPPVRHAARRCLRRVLPHIEADVAANTASYLLGRRTTWARWTDEQKALDELFERSDVLAALAKLLLDGTTGPLSACLRHALRYPNIDAHLIELARHARQPAVRALAYRCLISGQADWVAGFEWMWIDKVYFSRRRIPKLETRQIVRSEPAANLLRDAARDRATVVRKVAADALIEGAKLPDQENFIAQLANDKSAAVRSRADFLLRHPPSADALTSKP